MYKETKKTVLIPYFEKLAEISFDTILKLFSTFIMIYSLGLIFLPNLLSIKIVSAIPINSILFIILLVLLTWLHLSLWIETGNLNKIREKEVNLGITLSIIGLFLLTMIILKLIYPILGEIFNFFNLFYLGIFLIFLGILFELSRLDEELIYWLNKHRNIKNRIPITLLIGFAFFSIQNLPLFTFLLIIIPWIDIIIKDLSSSLISLINLTIKLILKLGTKIKLLFITIISFLLKLILTPFFFIKNNYRNIIKSSISIFSVVLMIFGMYSGLEYLLSGLLIFYLTWFRNINRFTFSILKAIYNQIIYGLIRIQLFILRIFQSIQNFFKYLYNIRIIICKTFSTFIGVLINLIVVLPYHIQFKEILFILGISLIYFPWIKEFNRFFSEIYNKIRRLFLEIVKALAEFLLRLKLFIKSVIKSFQDFIQQLFNKLFELYHFIVVHKLTFAKISSTIIGTSSILFALLYINSVFPKIVFILLGLSFIYFPWFSIVNYYISQFLISISSFFSNILLFVKTIFLNIFELIIFFFERLKLFTKKLIEKIKLSMAYLFQKRFDILKIISTISGILIVLVGYMFSSGLIDAFVIYSIGFILIYFPWLKTINSSIKRSIVFLVELINNLLRGIIELTVAIYSGFVNIFHRIISFLLINAKKIAKILIANFSIFLIILGFIGFPNHPFEASISILFGFSLLLITFFNEIKSIFFLITTYCHEAILKMIQKVKEILNEIKRKISSIFQIIYYYCNLFVFYCINWSLIWISVVFGSGVTLYGFILGYSGLTDNSGIWSQGLFNINLLLFFAGVSPFILLILSLGFLFTGVLLLRVISEHKENMMLKIVLHPKNLNRRIN